MKRMPISVAATALFLAVLLTALAAPHARAIEKIKLKYSDNNPPTAIGAVFFKEQWVPRVAAIIAPDYGSPG